MVTEHATIFDAGQPLAGIVTEPAAAVAPGVGVVVVNAGVVHRVGPNRMSVRLARALAARGFLAARFDLSGLGDSPARRDALPFEQAAVEETRRVMSSLQKAHGVDRFVLV